MESTPADGKPLSPIERLLVLQDRDRKIVQLTKEQTDIPARKKMIETRLASSRAGVDQAQEETKKKLSAAKQVDVDIESLKSRILKLREQQGQVKTNEQYRAIESEVANLQGQIKELEDREIALMEEAEGLKSKVAEATRLLQQEEAIVKTDWAAQDERLKVISTELEVLKVQRAELAVLVDPDWLSRYERVFKHRGDVAIVSCSNGCCGGCHQRLTPQMVQDAKRRTAIVSCNYCSRILYW